MRRSAWKSFLLSLIIVVGTILPIAASLGDQTAPTTAAATEVGDSTVPLEPITSTLPQKQTKRHWWSRRKALLATTVAPSETYGTQFPVSPTTATATLQMPDTGALGSVPGSTAATTTFPTPYTGTLGTYGVSTDTSATAIERDGPTDPVKTGTHAPPPPPPPPPPTRTDT